MGLRTDRRFVEVWFPDGTALQLDVDERLRARPGVAEALADWLMTMPAKASAADALRGRLAPRGLALRVRAGRTRLALEVSEPEIAGPTEHRPTLSW